MADDDRDSAVAATAPANDAVMQLVQSLLADQRSREAELAEERRLREEERRLREAELREE